MTDMDGHAKPPARRDHLWVLFIIAACALLELVASWVTIGAMSGFPTIGGKHGIPTDWTLAVTTEAYWAYALYSWLAGAPGPKSRRFAMWSAVAVFILSLTGQGAAHLVKPGRAPSPVLVVFVTSLPVIVLALIAILIHLRQLDREEAAETVRLAAEAERQAAIERAEADERTALRADVSALREELEAERNTREAAQHEAAEALARAEKLAAKLAALSDPKTRKQSAKNAQRSTPESAQGDDLTTELRALMELRADPKLWKPRMGGELARKLGVAPATGRRFHSRFVRDGKLIDPISERSADEPDARSGERS